MITINHLSFDFVTADEPFAHNLYVDWDSFCHACIEKVVDECFSAYDKDKVLYEIERLDLDLGVIPEDDFYKEFPFRLREELLKSLPMWNIQSESQKRRRKLTGWRTFCFIWNTAIKRQNGWMPILT